jgi:competence protein ComEC
MPRIHFLNVKEGDCSVVEHNSGHKTVIDVCNAKPVELVQEALVAAMAKSERGISGNFQQKKYPVNPISYMRDHRISSVFRYVQTHPDMDHMDGIEALFDEFSPTNFYDTDNTKEMSSSSWEGSPYQESDWQFYKQLRDTNPQTNPKRLVLYSGDRGAYRTQNWEGKPGGDGFHVLAPTPELVAVANEADEDYKPLLVCDSVHGRGQPHRVWRRLARRDVGPYPR